MDLVNNLKVYLSSLVDTKNVFCDIAFPKVDTTATCLAITHSLCPSTCGVERTLAPLSVPAWKRCLFSPTPPAGTGGKVVRRIIPESVAEPLFVVELRIAFDRLDKFFPAPAFIEFEVDEPFLLDPSVQGFVDWIVRWLSCTGHGSGDVRILDQLVVGHRCVDRSLVGVQDRRFFASLQHTDDVLHPPIY